MKKVGCLLFIVFFVLILVGLFVDYDDLGNGYKYFNTSRSDYHYIAKNDKMLIQNTVVDISQINNYVVGIQLPRCSNTHPQKIILSNKVLYFILNTENDGLVTFFSRKEFEKALKRREIFDKVELDYRKLQVLIINLYKKYNSYSKQKEKLEQCNNVEYKHLTHMSR
ncbi:hypothetical protein KO527_23470, partial [Pseudoalteromonas sp. C2R02]|uniref:hypothetical protein n=1 Tax=Pseudoalteromonas sp. C2R02 TaxID=2841565 RepID=UPI001C08DA67